ncbi:MAG: hypothetical protein PHP86_08185 [Nevskiales bacterium]|nr:hypothetical protein [Nevskiales bacterium]
MRANPIRRSLLILALVLGQWLVFAHTLQHPSLASELHCQICLHAHGLDSGITSTPDHTVALTGTTEAPPPPVLVAPALRPVRHSPIRGPPSHLA